MQKSSLTTPTGQLTEVPPYGTLGQFSYAPATQTTIVTTTTTTTTSFPPLMIRPPRNVDELDPKLYPLAASPTPSSIRRFCFNHGGMPTFFREADDPTDDLEKMIQEESSLRASNGTLRTVTKTEPRFETPRTRHSRPAASPARLAAAPQQPLVRSRKRSASPVSISEAANIAKLQRTHSSRRDVSGGVPVLQARNDRLEKRLAHSRTTKPPATPETDPGIASQSDVSRSQRSSSRRFASQPSQLQNSSLFDLKSDPESSTSLDAPAYGEGGSGDETGMSQETLGNAETAAVEERPTSSMTVNPAGTATPDTEEDLSTLNGASRGPSHRTRAARLALLDTTAAQDLSLPSPSLSPVTAAANLGNNDDVDAPSLYEPEDTQVALPLSPKYPTQSTNSDWLSTSTEEKGDLVEQKAVSSDPANQQQLSTPTLMDIPTMLDSFDVMADEMKTYIMYQLLRRCAKSTLHFVAETVNPALKCDFLGLLPLELSLNIVRYLDLKSLCRAAQVSKKWRHIINSDEKAWKDLFDGNGYTLPDGELKRAIKEGWGWQHPSGGHDFERDLGAAIGSDSEWSTTSLANSVASATLVGAAEVASAAATPSSTRRKRKAAAPKAATRRQPKRKSTARESAERAQFDGYLDQLAATEGPYAAAGAAALAVPNPPIGLPSLKNLHLFKSIYRRHHIIRRNWMDRKSRPSHLAFRAHPRNVVTCLQFDTDKILTGSDDTNINVYDTATGALRTKLEGHEGGVWALQYEGNVLVSGSTDRSVRIWDIERGVCTQIFQGHTSTVRCLQILMPTEVGRTSEGRPIMMPKQPLIITGSRDSSLRVWKLPQPGDATLFQTGPSANDAENPFFVRALTGHHHSVRAIAAHGDTLVSGSYDCTVRVWKISTGETLHRLTGHTQKVYSVVLDHKRNRCISGSMDYLVKVWSLETGSLLFNLEGHTSLVGLLDLKDDRLVSAAADSTLRIWDPETGHWKNTLSAHTGAITCFQHDGQKVVSGSDRTLKMWNVQTGEYVRDLLTDLSCVWQVKFDERRCVAAVQRNHITYIEILDFGATRDGFPVEKQGRRIVVDVKGKEITDAPDGTIELDNGTED
ncbi:WD40 repeat-like protein [Xylona heveae TC161]|uniref:WD40 repeat-like protein n=1 Tax=Xylona heveae (strain CBS 132557 / TC161) TaxID=1328760 RepID=A0A165IHK2_XYLHT|nr:WD40 repeat-like protein [Xylona heveae TC161]KZF24906.1 WD40 repeat-like protein [Xylona heveae TC161]